MNYEVHPACAAIPLPPEQEINELANSIKLSGLREPITLTKDNLLLDGRCRLKACTIAGVEVRTEIFEGDDPVMFVLDKNIHRRHLTNAQRELAVARLANLQRGTNQFRRKTKEDSSSGTILSIEDAAQKHGVPLSAIKRASTILKKAAPNVVEMVANGTVKLSTATAAVRHVPPENQAKWTAEDVNREGRKVINNEPAKRKKAGDPTPKPKRVNGMDRPPLYLEPGYSMPTDIGAVRRPGQPVQLCPSHIQDLRDDDIAVHTAAGNVASFFGRFQCTVEEFIAAAERLLAYKPVPGKKNGEETDYAANARQHLALAARNLDPALDWLTKLRAFIDEPNKATSTDVKAS